MRGVMGFHYKCLRESMYPHIAKLHPYIRGLHRFNRFQTPLCHDKMPPYGYCRFVNSQAVLSNHLGVSCYMR